MNNYTDELYAMLDELNARIEEIFEEHADSGALEMILPLFNKKATEFLEDFEEKVEKIELIEMEV